MKSIKDILNTVDMENWDLIIFKGDDGEGPISGLLVGDPDLIIAISEGFDTKEVSMEELEFDDETPPQKDDIVH